MAVHFPTLENDRRRKLKLVISVAIGLFVQLVPSRARADCYSDCMAGHSCSSSADWTRNYCSSWSSTCTRECLLANSFGAIAYSASADVWGYSHSYNSQSAAEQAALDNCKADDCEVEVWFQNGCGAVAAGDNGAVGWAQDYVEGRARTLALEECRKSAGTNCEVKVSHCSKY